MPVTRRGFAGAAVAALAAGWASPAFAQADRYAAAVAAIGAYAEAHLRHFGLPGLTLALTAPDGFSTVLNLGLANRETGAPITHETLFQIGSISKLINAAVLHQLVAEGRLSLSSRISDLAPAIPLPAGNQIDVQDLLDHLSGLPADAPLFPQGGLWTAYPPGEHWYYSNTGYDILGRLIAQLAGKPLAAVDRERVFTALAMQHTRGAVRNEDLSLYARGYDVADGGVFTPRVALAPAAWLELTSGAANIASTGDDMVRLLRSLADAAQGRGGLCLSPAAGSAFTSHAVASDTPGMRYGNGLMHVERGGRRYLHHTGGTVGFSSSFHLDVQSGTGAFASTNLDGSAEYRPQLLTRFTVDSLTNAAAGTPLPVPPSPFVYSAHTPAYIGRYMGPAGAFEISVGDPLNIVADGTSAPLRPVGGELFRTTHPTFRSFSLLFERSGNSVVKAAWGPNSYVRSGSGAAIAPSDPRLAKLAGRYVSDDSWFGSVTIVERGGRLWSGTETPLTRIGDNVFRVGEESWSPERALFRSFVEGRPQTLVLSGEDFFRRDR